MLRMLKLGAGTLSAGAALVSIASSSSELKQFVNVPWKEIPSASEARWAGVTPTADTATAIGDSIQLAVTATNARGATLTSVSPVWASSDESIASVDDGGTVVARGAGTATIVVTVGKAVARSRITVRQEPAAIRLGDSLIRIPEGEHGRLLAGVLDARGARIAGADVTWQTSDAAIAAVDSSRQALGVTPGEAMMTASYGALQGGLHVEVLAVPASVAVVTGEGQRAPAGRPLPTPVTAQIVSRSGRPVSGVPVEFRVQSGQGSCQPEVDTSDARGVVRTVWTLGEAPGRQHVAIAAEGVGMLPVLTAEADPVASRTKITLVTEDLRGTVGDTVIPAVVVRVTDSAGAALPDLPVAWRTPDGGSATAIGARTDSAGEARARWTLGPRAGTQRVQAQVGNPRTMPVFTARGTAEPGAAASVSIREGDAQSGKVGEALAKRVVVLAVDRQGNPVPDAPLVLLPKAGAVADSSVKADSTGQVRIRWTLGRAAGPQHLAVRVEGTASGVEVTARARSGPAVAVEFLPPAPSASPAKSAPRSVAIQVKDQYDNPVAGQAVRFTGSNATVSPARVVTDAKGRAQARWAPASKKGKRAITADLPGTATRATLTLP
jgi:hypothetical protein